MDYKKVTELNTYSKNHTLEHIRYYKRKKTIRRRLTATIILGLALIILASLPIFKNIQAAAKYEQEAIELADTLEATENKKQELEYEVALLEDEEYLAKIARKELNLSKVNEILINLPEDDGESLTEETDKKNEEKVE